MAGGSYGVGTSFSFSSLSLSARFSFIGFGIDVLDQHRLLERVKEGLYRLCFGAIRVSFRGLYSSMSLTRLARPEFRPR